MKEIDFAATEEPIVISDGGVGWKDAPAFGRTKSLKLALEFLYVACPTNPIIVETGTTRGHLGGGPVGDGWATLAFGWYCSKCNGRVYTIDILEQAIEQCKAITKEYENVIEYIVSDSVDFLSQFTLPINLLYLDSSDDPKIIHAELLAAYDKLDRAAVIVIDDTHDRMTRGKGVDACKFLLSEGWDFQSESGGQVLFTRNIEFWYLTPYSMYEEEQLEAEDLIKLDINDYDDKARVWQTLFFQELPPRESLPIVEDGVVKVLDLGCNTGYNTKFFERQYGSAVGVDINARLLFASRVNDAECYGMNADDLGFPDNSFSLVVAKDLIEHTMAPAETIKEAYRVLTDEGQFICMIPLDGEIIGMDDVVIHPAFNFGNKHHRWKATVYGVLARIFDAGFTDVGHKMYNHDAIFGEARPFGNRVLLITARKRKDIIRVPVSWLVHDYYWSVFVTLLCNGSCDYCIAKLSPEELRTAKSFYEEEALSSEEWAPFLNKLQRFSNHKLGVVGGEPTLYGDMFGLINALENYRITVTTNLKTKVFDDIKGFCDGIEDKESFRLNTSFHPGIISVDEFCSKIQALRDGGIFVDQVAMVDFPGSGFLKYYHEFIKKGVVLSPQSFLGIQRGILYPNSSVSGITNDPTEHGIFDEYEELYNAGFSYKEKSRKACHTRRFLMAPNGNVYKCHYHLYANKESLFNIKDVDEILPVSGEFTMCDDFGYCNPCDFPHARFRAPELNVRLALQRIMAEHPDSWDIIKGLIDEACNIEGLSQIIGNVLALLQIADDPLWALYNDERIIREINNFVLSGAPTDNTAAFLFAQLELTLFRVLPNGFNFYRILSDKALYKYISALSTIERETYEQFLISSGYLDEVSAKLVRNNLGRVLQSFAALDRDFRFFRQEELSE